MVSIFQKRQNKMIGKHLQQKFLYLLQALLCNYIGSFKTEATEGVSSVDGRTYGSFMMQMLTGSEDGRVDHVLQVSDCFVAMLSDIFALLILGLWVILFFVNWLPPVKPIKFQ